MAIGHSKNGPKENSAKPNRLLQLLKRGGKVSTAEIDSELLVPSGTASLLIAPAPLERSESLDSTLEREQERSSELALTEGLGIATFIPLESREISQILEVGYKGDLSPGSIVTLYLFYKNTTDRAWEGITVRGQLFSGMTYVPGTTFHEGQNIDDGGNSSPMLSSGYFISALPPSGKGFFSLQCEIDSDLPENSMLRAQFLVEEKGSPLAKVDGTAVVQGELRFSKNTSTFDSDVQNFVAPGQTVHYTLNLENTGSTELTRVFVTVKEFLHATYLPGTTTLGNQTVLDSVEKAPLFSPKGLYLGSLAPQSKATLAFKARVNHPLDNNRVVLASCSVRSDQVEPFELEPVKLLVRSAPEFRIGDDTFLEASSPEWIKPKENITYTLRYKNSGNANALDTLIRIQASSLLEFVPGTLRVGENRVKEEHMLFSSGILLGTVNSGEEGELSFQMRVHHPAENGTRVEVKGFLSVHKGKELGLPSVLHTVKSKPFFADPKLSWIEVNPRGQVEPSSVLTYSFHFQNGGDAANAYMTRLWCQLSPDVTYLPGTLALNGSKFKKEEEAFSFFSAEGLGVDKVGHGIENVVTLQVRVNTPLENGTVLDVGGMIEAEDVSPYQLLPVTTVIHGTPDFSQGEENRIEVLTQSRQEEVRPGEVLTYNITVKNRGPVHAKQVIVTGVEPTNTRYIPNKTKRNGIPISDDEEKASPIFSPYGLNLGAMRVGDMALLSFQVKVNAPLEKGAKIEGNLCVASDNISNHFLEMPALAASSYPDFTDTETNFMEVFPDAPVPPGHVVTYVLYYKNVGNDDARDVTLKTGCPEKASYVKGSTRLNGIPVPDTKGTCPLFGKGLKVEEVKWNRLGNVSFQLKMEETGMIRNRGYIEWSSKIFETNTVSNSVNSLVDFSNKKHNYLQVFPQGEISPGTLLTHTVHYKNEGTVTAKNAAVRLQLSSHIQYLPNSTIVNGQPVTDALGKSPCMREEGFPLGNLAPDQAGEISLRCMVVEPLDDGTEVFVVGKVFWNGNESFQLDPVKNTVKSHPNFGNRDLNFIELVRSPKDFDPLLTCVVNFKNSGNSNAYNAVFRVTLPSGWGYVPDSTSFNGRPIADEQSSSLFSNQGLSVKRIEADEEGNFTFQVMAAWEKRDVYPRVSVEAQQMELQEIAVRN